MCETVRAHSDCARRSAAHNVEIFERHLEAAAYFTTRDAALLTVGGM